MVDSACPLVPGSRFAPLGHLHYQSSRASDEILASRPRQPRLVNIDGVNLNTRRDTVGVQTGAH